MIRPALLLELSQEFVLRRIHQFDCRAHNFQYSLQDGRSRCNVES
jgi:hypothetical protein